MDIQADHATAVASPAKTAPRRDMPGKSAIGYAVTTAGTSSPNSSTARSASGARSVGRYA